MVRGFGEPSGNNTGGLTFACLSCNHGNTIMSRNFRAIISIEHMYMHSDQLCGIELHTNYSKKQIAREKNKKDNYHKDCYQKRMCMH